MEKVGVSALDLIKRPMCRKYAAYAPMRIIPKYIFPNLTTQYNEGIVRATNPSVQPVQTDEIVRAVGRCGAVPAGGGGEW